MRRVTGVTGVTGGVLRRAHARPDDDRGAITFIVAAMLVVMIGLAALVVDRGMAADQQRQAQAAADASALAAALALAKGGPTAPTDAVNAAKNYARQNFGVTAAEWAACTAPAVTGFTPINLEPCITQNATTKAVRVTLPSRAVPSVFSGIFGVRSRTIASAASAGFAPILGANCVLCIMGPVNGGVGQIRAAGGDVYARDIFFNGGPNPRIDVTGGAIGYSGTWDTDGNFSPSDPAKTAVVDDPFIGIPQPDVDETKVAIAAPSGRCNPNTYYTDIRRCTGFDPGVYVLVGTTKHIAPLSTTDVMFFLTCSRTTSAGITAKHCDDGGEPGANFGGAGNTSVVLGARQSGPYKGFALWVDRNNTTGQSWAGNGDLRVNGTLYSANPAGLETASGNGLITVRGGITVLGSLRLNGNHLHLDVDGTAATSNRSPVTSIPRLSS